MTIDFNTAFALFKEKFAEKYGENEELDPGDKIAAVFDNCTMIVSIEENKELSIEFLGGKPLRIEGNLNMYKEEN